MTRMESHPSCHRSSRKSKWPRRQMMTLQDLPSAQLQSQDPTESPAHPSTTHLLLHRQLPPPRILHLEPCRSPRRHTSPSDLVRLFHLHPGSNLYSHLQITPQIDLRQKPITTGLPLSLN